MASEGKDIEASMPEVPRENMIATAVKFLQNPKVRQSPFAQRQQFLERKGLTTEEIKIAIERSGTAQDEHMQPVAMPMPSGAPATQAVVPAQQPVSWWARIRDILSTAVLAGGSLYALYQFYKRYIAPRWFGPSREQKQLEEINQSLAGLQKNIIQMIESLQGIQNTVNKQSSSSSSHGSIGDYPSSQNSQISSEIKEEIRSLKGLLLNRKQFPPTPVSQPVIPAWQLTSSAAKASTESSKKEIECENKSQTGDAAADTTDMTENRLVNGNTTEDEEKQGLLGAEMEGSDVHQAQKDKSDVELGHELKASNKEESSGQPNLDLPASDSSKTGDDGGVNSPSQNGEIANET